MSPASQESLPSLTAHTNLNGIRLRHTPDGRLRQTLAELTNTTITVSTKSGQYYEGVISSTKPLGGLTPGVTLRNVIDVQKPGTPVEVTLFKDTLFIAFTDFDSWELGVSDWFTVPAAPVGLPPSQFSRMDEYLAPFPAFMRESTRQGLISQRLTGEARRDRRTADAIMNSGASNPHISEERTMNLDDSGANKEDKESTITRAPNAYIPPGEHKRRQQQPQTQAASAWTTSVVSPPAESDTPRLSVNGPDGTTVVTDDTIPKSTSTGPSTSTNQPTPVYLPAYLDLVPNKRQRLTQKEQMLTKGKMDERTATVLEFPQTSKLNEPIPDDLVPVSPRRYKLAYSNKASPAPLDLTHSIIKLGDNYLTGGSFGDVYKGHYKSPTGVVEVAVKAFRFPFTMKEGSGRTHAVKMVRRELGIWKRLEHGNIVPFLGTATGFGMQGSLALVSEWMPNGCLHRFLEDHGEQLHVMHQLQLMRDIANGLDYLHSFPESPIVHGDLNGNNVLVDGNFTARLVDFGYSTVVGSIPEVLTYLQRSTARPGAIRWSAPELVIIEEEEEGEEGKEKRPQRTPKSDIYSFGCLSLQVLSGKQPWSEASEDGTIVLRMSKGQKPRRPKSREMEDRHWEFIQCCWSSPEERPGADILVSDIQAFLNDCPHSPALRDMLSPGAS